MQAVRSILNERGDSMAYEKLDLDNNYPVYIDLEKAVKNPGCEADILMREGDRIFVPEYNPIVRVSGDVMFPNTLFYEHGKGYKYYVNEAGGFGHRAKKSKTFIVYQNGRASLVKKGAATTGYGARILTAIYVDIGNWYVEHILKQGMQISSTEYDALQVCIQNHDSLKDVVDCDEKPWCH